MYRYLLLTLLLVSTACSNSCTSTKADTSTVDSLNVDSTTMKKPISEVLARHTNTWMSIPGVVGTGETAKDGKPAVMIMVSELTDSLRRQLPSEVEGYPVVVDEVGIVRANSKQ